MYNNAKSDEARRHMVSMSDLLKKDYIYSMI